MTDHVVGNRQMARKTDHAADHAALADRRAAGNAGAGGNGRVRADDHVVADLDLIVQFDAVLDDRIIDGAAIDGGIGADLHIVADPHAAHLRHLDPSPRIRRETEAVGADHRAGMQNAALPDRSRRHTA